jgi:peptidoglycan/xylan/chitin deacetylase (PgdA/CDA1 family)
VNGQSVVLCYHAASPTWRHDLSLPPERLETQVRALVGRGFTAVSGPDLVQARGRVLHVTFDDAFRSIGPLVRRLSEHGVPSTVFACTDYADRPRPLAVAELFEQALAQPRELETMGWEELRSLAGAGIEIGSHTRTHPHLTRLGDVELRAELYESRVRIEDELGRPCRLLAYPYGEHDARVREAAREAGYEAAFALADGSWSDRLRLRRVGLYTSGTGLSFRLKTLPPAERAIAAVLATVRR